MKLLSTYTRERAGLTHLNVRVRVHPLSLPLINDIRIYNKRIKISHVRARAYAGEEVGGETAGRPRQGVIKKSAIVKASDRKINGSS